MAAYTDAYIYLIREREFLLLDQPVYKIGRSEQHADRTVQRIAKGYKKGSETLLTLRIPLGLYKDVESILKAMLWERFNKCYAFITELSNCQRNSLPELPYQR